MFSMQNYIWFVKCYSKSCTQVFGIIVYGVENIYNEQITTAFSLIITY